MADYAPAVKKLLKENGCRLERQGKGDHEIWFSPRMGRRSPVDHKIKSRHNASGIPEAGRLVESVLTHRADRAMMTCLVFSVEESRHVHFIDGADGGYALAALQLKAQLQALASVGGRAPAITPAAG